MISQNYCRWLNACNLWILQTRVPKSKQQHPSLHRSSEFHPRSHAWDDGPLVKKRVSMESHSVGRGDRGLAPLNTPVPLMRHTWFVWLFRNAQGPRGWESDSMRAGGSELNLWSSFSCFLSNRDHASNLEAANTWGDQEWQWWRWFCTPQSHTLHFYEL